MIMSNERNSMVNNSNNDDEEELAIEEKIENLKRDILNRNYRGVSVE